MLADYLAAFRNCQTNLFDKCVNRWAELEEALLANVEIVPQNCTIPAGRTNTSFMSDSYSLAMGRPPQVRRSLHCVAFRYAGGPPPFGTICDYRDDATRFLSRVQVIKTTIRQQLDAFARDDAKTAFGYAAPDVRRKFGSSDDFLSMVRESYEPVYRAANVQFIELVLVEGRWVQTVQLVDSEGRVWRALFSMKRQADKTWKVSGCQLLQTAALAT